MSGTDRRAEALAVLALVIALGGWATWRPRAATPVPSRVAPGSAEPWMADALPGIGPKRREAAATAIRARRFDELPAPARVAVGEAFTP